MKVSIQRFKAEGYSADATAVFIPQDQAAFAERSGVVRGMWGTAAGVLDAKDFAGAKDSSVTVYTGSKKSPRLIMVGIGESGKIDLERLRRAAAMAAQRAAGLKCESLAIVLPA